MPPVEQRATIQGVSLLFPPFYMMLVPTIVSYKSWIMYSCVLVVQNMPTSLNLNHDKAYSTYTFTYFSLYILRSTTAATLITCCLQGISSFFYANNTALEWLWIPRSVKKVVRTGIQFKSWLNHVAMTSFLSAFSDPMYGNLFSRGLARYVIISPFPLISSFPQHEKSKAFVMLITDSYISNDI